MKLIMYTDGGARGNPGPAATGVVIKNQKGEVIKNFGTYLGKQTNNFAEYSAAIEAFEAAYALGAEEVELYLDSKLVAEQLNRNWKVKHPEIQKLFLKAWSAMQKFKRATIRHIAREKNKESDAEVNKVLDSHA